MGSFFLIRFPYLLVMICIVDISHQASSDTLEDHILMPQTMLQTSFSALENRIQTLETLILDVLKVVKTLACPGFSVSGVCYLLFTDRTRTWDEAQAKCHGVNAILAEPKDSDAIVLRRYLFENLGSTDWVGTWLGAKADGQKYVFQHSARTVAQGNPLWVGWDPSVGYCLELEAYESSVQSFPGRPYDWQDCTYKYNTLCQVNIIE